MTKQKIKLLSLAALLGSLTVMPLRAAEATTDYKPFTLSADVGTLGLGVSAGWRFADHFGAHVGVNYFSHSEDGNEIEGVNYNSKLRLFSAPLGLDIYPWQKSSFRITVGALINKNQLEGFSPNTGPGTFVELNGNLIQSSDVGNLSLEAKQKVFSPYFSIGGELHLNKAKTWSLDYELGVAYTGSPEVTLTRDGPADPLIDTQLEGERQQLEDKAKDYKFYPIVKVGVSFSF